MTLLFNPSAPVVFSTLPTTPPPAVKHHFKMLETSGSVLTDSIGGCVWDISAGGSALQFNQLGSVGSIACNMAINAVPIPLSSGTFHTFDPSRYFMVIAAGRVLETATDGSGGTRFSLGDINNIATVKYSNPQGLGLSNGEFHAAAGHNGTGNYFRSALAYPQLLPPPDALYGADSSPIVSLDGNFHGKDVLEIFVYTGSNTGYFESYDIATGGKLIYGWRVDATGYAASLTPNPCMRFANWAMYGYMALEFTSLPPANARQGALWLAQQWLAGNRTSFAPHFYGLS